MELQTATGLVLAWGATLTAIWAIGDVGERVFNDDRKEQYRKWLANVRPAQAVAGWPRALAAVFDGIFGKRHLSWKCFGRSCAASLIAVFILTLIVAALDPEQIKSYGRIIARVVAGKPLPGLLGYYTDHVLVIAPMVYAVTVNLVPDYLALLSTRWVIHLLSRRSTILWTLGLLLLDLLLTFAVAILGVLVGLTLLVEAMNFVKNSEMMPVSELIDAMQKEAYRFLVGVIRFEQPVTSGGLSFYSTFVTSAWLWLYVLAGLFVKVARYFGLTLSGFRWLLNFEKAPILSTSVIAMVLATIVYWWAVLAGWIRIGEAALPANL